MRMQVVSELNHNGAVCYHLTYVERIQGGGHTRLQGGGDPIQTTGQKLWYYIYSSIMPTLLKSPIIALQYIFTCMYSSESNLQKNCIMLRLLQETSF